MTAAPDAAGFPGIRLCCQKDGLSANALTE
jgi:hypothetical protein